MTARKSNIPLKSLAQFKHIKFLIATEKQALVAYKFVMEKMRAELRSLMKKNKLAKSEDPTEGLEPGWSSEVPTIQVDMEALLGKTLDKYLAGLKWVLMGAVAGKDAVKAAESIGLKGKVTPGMIHAAYLQSIDAHSQHYKDVTGEEAPEMPIDLIKASFDQISKRLERLVNQTLAQLKTDVLMAVDQSIDRHNFKALNSAHQEAHDLLPVLGPEEAALEASEAVSDILSAKAVVGGVRAAADKFETKWNTAVRSDLAAASAAGTHQALLEIHGADNPNVKVAWVEMQDERVCSFCKSASKGPDGKHKLYDINDFEPSGYNYSRKRADWKLSIPPTHISCRCQLVYIPPGFEVDGSGGIRKKI